MKADHRRTITPFDARIDVDDGGFVVSDPGGLIADVRWRDVDSIHAYTRFIDRSGSLCLDFRRPASADDKDGVVVLNEGVIGWSNLVSALANEFPGIDSHWVRKASGDASSRSLDESMARDVPAFLSRWTNVWSRLPID